MPLNTEHPIAVSGMGCCCAAGPDLATVWRNLWHDEFPRPVAPPFACIEPQPVFACTAPLLLSSPFHGRPPDIDNRTLLLALQACLEALTSAAIKAEDLTHLRLGIALGTTVRCHFHDDDYFLAWQQGKRPAAKALHRFLNENLATALQEILGSRGPTSVVTNACASGTDAIGLAASWLRHDLCDLVICGGADELSRLAFHGFAGLMLTSDAPCTPFATGRRGLNLGEGAGILLLERETDRRRRGAEAQGWLLGYGAGADGYHPTAPHPQGRGLQQAIRSALRCANLHLDDIALINGHGTGTTANDLAETTALKNLGFSTTPLLSTKGATGHTLGAAGGIEAVLTLRALQEGATFGTIGCHEPDPALPVQPLCQGEEVPLAGRLGLSHSLAFGGGNAALILEGAS
ncbi:MAG: beta-ketoacyl-[acyl-carrier-protein] synthase family protein [Desulfobulbaceae bacterium]|nr:MAG: beta-ketoacyl-[acyl-carrier-protein] synthase family protein [Desulfobulbaceae bacterium]